MSFPSGSITISNLDQATDKPKDARVDLLDSIQKLNSVIASYNANNGICGLNSSGKVDSSKLTGQVDTDQLVSEAVETAKIKPLNITDGLIANTTISKGKLNFIAEDTTMGGSSRSHDVIPTQKSVKDYVDSTVSSATPTIGNASTVSTSGTASSSGFLTINLTAGTSAGNYSTTNYHSARCVAVVNGITHHVSSTGGSGTRDTQMCIPVASGHSWSITTTGTNAITDIHFYPLS